MTAPRSTTSEIVDAAEHGSGWAAWCYLGEYLEVGGTLFNIGPPEHWPFMPHRWVDTPNPLKLLELARAYIDAEHKRLTDLATDESETA